MILLHYCYLSFVALLSLVATNSPVFADEDLKYSIFEDALAVWQSFRDPENGVWCDTLRFNQVPMVTCGENNDFYSSAGTG